MDLALVLVGPIALLAILTARRASRQSSPFVAALQADDGPWVVVIMGLWGALTKRPFKLWHGLGLESLVVAVVFAALGIGASFLIEKPRVGAKAIGPLILWAITGTLAQLLGSEASDVAFDQGSVEERRDRAPCSEMSRASEASSV